MRALTLHMELLHSSRFQEILFCIIHADGAAGSHRGGNSVRSGCNGIGAGRVEVAGVTPAGASSSC